MRASPPCDYILAQLVEQLSLSHPITSHRITSFAYLQSPCWAYITHPQRWPMQSMPCRRFYPCSISISILSRMPIFAGDLPSRGKLFCGAIYRQSKDSGSWMLNSAPFSAGLFGFVIYLPCSRFDLKWVKPHDLGRDI